MKLIFADEAWEDYLYWQKQDRKMVERINKLIREIQREPFAGIGKPEPLKHALSGFWSRRITDEHRVVYRVEGMRFGLHSCGFIIELATQLLEHSNLRITQLGLAAHIEK